MTRQDALDILFEETPTDYIMDSDETPTDYIMDSDETPDFFQFHVSCGGDACTYRIYKKDGSIYEK